VKIIGNKIGSIYDGFVLFRSYAAGYKTIHAVTTKILPLWGNCAPDLNLSGFKANFHPYVLRGLAVQTIK
jgi:hypothetical protein